MSILQKSELIQKYKSILVSNSLAFNRDYQPLLTYLIQSSFFDMPASTRFHLNCPGGLAQHILNLHECLLKLLELNPVPSKLSSDVFDPFIVSIAHDMNKIDGYKISERNSKINGQWVQLKYYDHNGSKDMYPHNLVSLDAMRRYVSLSKAEELAIFHAEGNFSTFMERELLNAQGNAFRFNIS